MRKLEMLLAFCGCAMQIARGPLWMDHAYDLPPPPWTVSSSMGEGYESTVKLALKASNEAAGCELFKFTSGKGIISIKGDQETTGTFAYRGEGFIYIQLDDVSMVYVLLEHELGHVMGLAHQGYGLMAPELSLPKTSAQRLPTLDEWQREGLQKRWCR